MAGDENAFKKILKIINKEFNVDFTHYKESTLKRRLDKRLKVLQIQDLATYYDLLIQSTEEANFLINDLVINITDFFRDREAFRFLYMHTLPKKIQEIEAPTEFRVWVVGCSTGQEAYTIAILLEELRKKEKRNFAYKILATDISNPALAKASKGIYCRREVKSIPAELLQQYFDYQNNKHKIKRNIRENIIFSYHNITQDIPFCKLDLVSCRNVLIYTKKETKQHVIEKLLFALKPNGHLFLGSSEGVENISQYIKTISNRWRIFQKLTQIPTPRPISLNNFQTALSNHSSFHLFSHQEMPKHTSESIERIYEQFLLDNYLPSLIIIDGDGNLKYITQAANKYLKIPNNPTVLNIFEMVATGIAIAIKTALQQVEKNQQAFMYQNVSVDEKHKEGLDITIYPIELSRIPFPLFGVKFKHYTHKTPQVASNILSVEEDNGMPSIVTQKVDLTQNTALINLSLQRELEHTKRKLRNTVEELAALREEHSATHEEYQAVHEELKAINIDYQSNIKNLTEANDDLNNLLHSTKIGTLFLDNDLKIRRFTDSVKQQINLVESDIGRPISHFTTNFNYPKMIEKARLVLETEKAFEKEVKMYDNRWFLMRIYLYQASDKSKKGVVITFVGITPIKEVQQKLAANEKTIRTILAAIPDTIFTISKEGIYLEILSTSSHHTHSPTHTFLDKHIKEVLPTPLAEQAHQALQTAFQTNLIQDFIQKVTIKEKKYSFDFRIIRMNANKAIVIIRDITKHQQAKGKLRESEQRFQKLFEDCPIGVAITDLNWNLQKVNKAFTNIVGYSTEELLTLNVRNLTHPDDRTKNFDLLQNLRGGHISSYNLKKRYVTKKGAVRWVNLAVSLVRDEHKLPIYAIALVEDITEKQQNLAIIKENAFKYRTLVNRSFDAIITFDAYTLQPLSFNQKSLAFFDYTIEEFKQLQLFDLLPDSLPTEVKKVKMHLAELKEKKNVQFETIKQRKDKTLFECEVSLFTLKENKANCIIAIIKDISKRKKQERKIIENENRFRSIFELSPLGLMIIKDTKTIIKTNQSLTRILGYTDKEFTNLTITEFTHPDDIAVSKQLLQKLGNRELSTINIEKRYVKKDQTIIHAHTRIKSIFNENKEYLYDLVIIDDITEKHNALIALQENKQFIEAITNTIPQIIKIFDFSTKSIIYHNHKEEGFLGYTSEETKKHINNLYKDIIHPVDFKKFVTNGYGFYKALKDGEVFEKQMRLRHKNGEYRWYRGTEIIFKRSKNGLPLQLMTVAEDITENKKINTQIRISEAKYKAIFNNSTDGIIIFDIDSNKNIDCNERLAQMLGIERQALLNNTALSFSPIYQSGNIKSIDKRQQIHKKALASNQLCQYEWRFIRVNSDEFLETEVIMTPFTLNNNKLWLNIIRDISERKKQEKLIKENEQKFKGVFNNSFQLIGLIDTSGTILAINKTALEFSGQSKEQMINKFVGETYWMQEENNNSTEVVWQAILRGYEGKFSRKEIVIKDKNRQGRILDFSLTPITNDKGSVIFLIPEARDITELVLAKRALTEKERLYRAIAENIPDGLVMVFDKDLRVVTIKGTLVEQIPYALPSLIGEIPFNIDDEAKPHWLTIKPFLEKALAGAAVRFEHTISENWTFLIKVLPLTDTDKEVSSILLLSQDISKIKQTEQNLIRKNKELRRYIDSNLELEKFAYVASHDLKEPLRTIKGFAQLIERNYKDVLDDRGKEFLQYILDGSTSMTHLINDLLLYSRVNSTKEFFEQIDPAKIFLQVKSNLSTTIKENEAVINIGDMPPSIETNRTKIVQVFQNLIANAIKFRKPRVNPIINISCKEIPDYWQFAISDNGIGIDQIYFDKIFLLFKKLHSPHDYKGTGLGLPICKKIIEKQGGRIWLTSKVNVGTTFYFEVNKKPSLLI